MTIPLTSIPGKPPQPPYHRAQTQNSRVVRSSNSPETALSSALAAFQLNEHQGVEQGGNREVVPGIPGREEEGKTELHKLSEEHEKLIDVILEEEDQLIDSHKRHIDAIMELAKTVF